MDVISILKKMRIEPKTFNINIEAEVTEEHPKHYSSMHLIYEFSGDGLDEDKLRKAIELSQDRYCGVSVVYRKAMPVTYEIKIVK
jgi:putative redox protein